MPKGISRISDSLRQIGNTDVADLDFVNLLNKDIRDFEFTQSLRRLGNTKVMDWDFRTVIPAVNKLARQEVDLVDIFKRTAHYKIMEWDFRSTLHPEREPAPDESASPRASRLGSAEMQALTLRLRDFLQTVAENLIDEPGHARIKVQEIAPDVLRFNVVLVKKDVAVLIGMEGHTATAIRNLLKAAAGMHGVHALLEILSHEEEAEQLQALRNGNSSFPAR